MQKTDFVKMTLVSTAHKSIVQISECRLRLSRPIQQHEAPGVRGFFGRNFEDEVLMHNHGPDGDLIYQYPRVQFKVLDRACLLMGINEIVSPQTAAG